MDSQKSWALGVIVAATAGGYYSGLTEPASEAPVEIRSGTGFDLNPVGEAPVPVPRLESPRPLAEPLRDAVGSAGGGSRPQVVSVAGGADGSDRAGASAASRARWAPSATGPAALTNLLSDPARFLVERTHLGSAARLRGFVSDPRRVQGYLSHPLIRGVLDEPALVKQVLGRPALVKAFLRSPAMRDDEAVEALLRSPLAAGLLKSRGVKAALSDPAVAGVLLADSELLVFLGRHPAAAAALTPRR